MGINKKIPSKITIMRVTKGITQKDMSATIGINPTVLSNIERRVIIATGEQQRKIARFLSVPIEEVFEPVYGVARIVE